MSDRPPKVAIYIRVSTVYQVDRDSLPMQRQDLEAYSRLILGIEDYVFFEDAGYSGKDTDRPAFQDMMARIRLGEFSHVLVWKIDRISRNLLDFAEMYAELRSLRVTFVSKNEQFDTSTAIGEAMLKIILVFAELERNMTSERVTATMIARASNGIWNGGRIPYGYDYDPDTSTFSINEAEASVCLLLRDDYLHYHSLVHTARFLNSQGFKTRAGADWTPTAVWIIASSPFYTGSYRYNRYKGTKGRTENPEDEWIIVPDHHPAIFSQSDYEAMYSLREANSRLKNSPGQQMFKKNVHVFQRLAYCGKCGSRLTATPGRLHADGYRTTIHSCPLRRRTDECDNPSVTDLFLGEFTLNYVLNMLNAKKSFSQIDTPADLQRYLLFGSAFSEIVQIEESGLNEFFNLLSRYKSDDSFALSPGRPKKKRAATDPEADRLKKEKEKLERALSRLQNLFLYSEASMPEAEYISRRSVITSQLDAISSRLGMISASSATLSDEEFIRQASHLLISRQLQDKAYIYYKELARSVSPEVLQSYMEQIVDSIYVTDGHVTSIVFKNGLRHNFLYE